MQNATNHIKRELQLTADGSHTLFIPEMDEHYHSVNGAVQESRHVFIEAGLHQLERKEITVLEIGFGTGLNAFLTLLDAEAHQRKIHYYSVELYPLDADVIGSLNYGEMICAGRKDVFQALHQAEWDVSVPVTEFFELHKIQGDSNTCDLPDRIDLVYFDAFAPEYLRPVVCPYDRRRGFDDLLCERRCPAYDERSRIFCRKNTRPPWKARNASCY